MSRFLVLYRAPVSAREQMESATPEQRRAGMELWQAWAAKAGSAIVDMGAPLGDGVMVGDGEAYTDAGGYSILEADSERAVADLLREHPHFHTPGGQIEVHAMLAVPGTQPTAGGRVAHPTLGRPTGQARGRFSAALGSEPLALGHRKVLKAAGLVADRPAGKQRIYRVDPAGLAVMRAELDRFWSKTLAAYRTVVERSTEEDP